MTDGGIPLLSRVIDGGAAEIFQIIGTMNAPRAIAGPKEFQPTADSKLISYGNVAALIKVGTISSPRPPLPRSTTPSAPPSTWKWPPLWTIPRSATRTSPPQNARPAGSWKTSPQGGPDSGALSCEQTDAGRSGRRLR